MCLINQIFNTYIEIKICLIEINLFFSYDVFFQNYSVGNELMDSLVRYMIGLEFQEVNYC